MNSSESLVSLRDLELVAAVASCRSFTDAAITCHMSQSSLSRAVNRTEHRLGVRLFERTTRSVTPTPSGAELIKLGRRVLESHRSAMREFQLFRDGMGGTVRIAAIPSAAAVLLPVLVREASERYPGIQIEILDSLAQVALAGLLNGEVDIAITTPSHLPNTVRYTDLLEDGFAVVHCGDHPFAARGRVTWAELAREPLVMFDGNSSIRSLTDAALTEVGATIKITAEASNIPVIAGFVSAGLGVAAVPGLVVPLMTASGLDSTPLSMPDVVRRLGIAQVPERSESPACTRVVALLRQIADHHRTPRPGRQLE